ncbi:MAG: hypothetical protein ACTS6J_26175, partial [Burkholderiales bacterium]
MGCRYILLPDELAAGAGIGSPDASSLLRSEGLLERHLCSGSTLFASPETPTLRIPGGGTIIGHVFLDNGTPLGETSPFIASLSPGTAGSALLDRC